jgi:predicted RNA binding protein YcfA (HicA-like mRNA interferase family)
MVDYAPEIRRLLLSAGWERLRSAKGDHAIWWDPRSGVRATVDSKIKSRHTANEILKQAKIGKKF